MARVGLALVATGLAAVAISATPALTGLVTGSGEPEQVSAGAPEPAPPIPELSSSERAEAVAIVRTDPVVRRLLRGRAFRVDELGPWTTEDGTVIGASLVVRLGTPATFPMSDWPAATYVPDARGRPFRQGTVRLAAENVSALNVRVDWTLRAVVSIEPDAAGAVLTPGVGLTRIPPDDPGY